MMRFKGIQAQLFIAFGSLVLIISLFYSRLGYLVVEVSEDILIEFLLEQEALYLADQWQASDTPPQPRYDYFELLTTLDNVPAAALTIPDGNDVMSYQQDDLHYSLLPVPSPAESLWIRVETSELLPLQRFSNVVMVFFASIGVAALVLAVLSTWFLAARMAKPIQTLTDDVRAQGQGSDASISGLQRQDEIGELAQAFDSTYSQLRQALQREQNFTHDVSHELRTPITLIKNTLAMHQKKPLDNDALQLLDQATSELKQTVEVLLALARKENLSFHPCPMRSLIEQAVLAIHLVHPDFSFQVRVTVPAQWQVVGNPYLIGLLCQNLVNNGFYHGAEEGMKIYTSGEQLVFENAIGEQVERPYYQGLGHGQYLVKRIASVMNWQIHAEQNEGVYRVTLSPKLAD